MSLTADQAALAERTADRCRFVWNAALEQRREWRRRGRFTNYFKQRPELVEAKREQPWLCDAPSHCLLETLRDLDRACRQRGTFRVHWKLKRRTAAAFRFPDSTQIHVQRLNRRWGRVKLPKLGWCRFRWTRALDGEVRNATLNRDGGQWYVSFCVNLPDRRLESSSGPAVGLDRGVAAAVATSDGQILDFQPLKRKEAERMLRLQRHLARQEKGSRRREANKRRLSRLWRRVRYRRLDFCHQNSTRLAENHGLIAIEDLKVRSMTSSAKGTLTIPGRNVRQKAGLNRNILAKGWGVFATQLAYKCVQRGVVFVKVPAQHTSQTCSSCGVIDSESRQGRGFACRSCGLVLNADVNAAIVIRERGIRLAPAAGLAVAGRGAGASGQAVKRQPPEEAA